MSQFEPIELLDPEDVMIGSIVLYVMPTKERHVRPAIVSGIMSDTAVRLHVFCQGAADDLMNNQSMLQVHGVRYSVTGEPNTWRWEL